MGLFDSCAFDSGGGGSGSEPNYPCSEYFKERCQKRQQYPCGSPNSMNVSASSTLAPAPGGSVAGSGGSATETARCYTDDYYVRGGGGSCCKGGGGLGMDHCVGLIKRAFAWICRHRDGIFKCVTFAMVSMTLLGIINMSKVMTMNFSKIASQTSAETRSVMGSFSRDVTLQHFVFIVGLGTMAIVFLSEKCGGGDMWLMGKT